MWFALAVASRSITGRRGRGGNAGPVRLRPHEQPGLLRLLTSSGPMRGQPLTNDEAWAVWDGFLADDRVRVFPELPALEEPFRSFSRGPQASPKLWVDAYLAAHASANDAVLVTFDQAFARYDVPCRILS